MIFKKGNGMKILHVIHSLRTGGAERVVVDLARGLARRGHENRICVFIPVNTFEKELAETGENGITVHSLLNIETVRFVPNIPKIYLRLKAVVCAFKPDVIHCHLRTDSAICGLLKGTPIVRTIQNSRSLDCGQTLSNKIVAWMERRSFFVRDMNIVACGEAAKRVLEPYLSKRGGPKITVIENGIDLKRFQTYGGEERGKKAQIVTVGTLYKDKNRKMSVLALNELLRKGFDCFLWILGDGVERGNLEKLVVDLKIQERVKFITKFEDVGDYLRQASLYWSTSKNVGWSIANLEAMAMGLPVVATDVAGNREMLSSWPEYLVPFDDYKSLAEASANLLRSPQLMKEVGNAMQKLVLEKYNAEDMVEKYIRFYSGAIQRRQT